MLSDGHRAILALVMDLVRNMSEVNSLAQFPENQSYLDSPAIVVIDEVELHLHPSWQQTVLPNLLKIFPQTQFVVTTNSPQVLSSISSQHIRILDQGELLPWPEDIQTEGAESGRLLQLIMGVDQRPRDNKWVKKLFDYGTLINKRQFGKKINDLSKELYNHFGRNDPQLLNFDLIAEHIRRKDKIEQCSED
jgi:predicted ATP-binding protein involved in virulence